MIDIEKTLSKGRAIQIKPEGYSMYPMMVPGRDEAVIEPATSENIKRGDVVLYRRQGSILVLHRVVKINKKGIYFVGDNQEEVEGPLPLSCVRGKLTAFIRKGRYISVKNPIYRIMAYLWLLIRPFRNYIKRPAAFIKHRLR